MKKTSTLILFFITSIVYQSCSPSSFATVCNNGWKVTLYHYTGDVKIQENGQNCTLVGDAFAGRQKPGYAAYSSGLGASGGYLLYTQGIQLGEGNDEHHITLIKNDKTITVTYNRKSQPFLDVTAALGESKVVSMADLQKEFVREHSRKKKKA
jgi:hypothetical protein